MKHFNDIKSLRYQALDGRTTHQSMRKACRKLVDKFSSKDELAMELNEYLTNYSEWTLYREIIIPLFQEAASLPGAQIVLVRLPQFTKQNAWSFAELIAEFEEILGTDSESFDLFNTNKGA